MIVPESRVEVQQDQAQEQNKSNNSTIHGASADSAVPQKLDVITTCFDENKLILAKELKEIISFRALLEADGHKLQQSGSYFKCCCPFHNDSTPSFFVCQDDNYAKCYGCDWYGDIFKYESEFHRVDFKQAWFRLNDFVRNNPRSGRKAKSALKKIKTEEPQFTPKQLAERKHYADRLATESWLADELCRKRFERTGEEWNSETIRNLAREGSLGWAGGALAFIYPRGTKYRDWPGKEFIWECDGSSLWRGQLLPVAKHIYLTESETDAINMLDAGIERKEAGAAIIAVSGASGFQAGWAEQFKDKAVTLCFDNDEAGIEGANKTGLLLKPFVSNLLIYTVGRAA